MEPDVVRAAEDNFHAAAREGIDRELYWPGVRRGPATELVLRRLLPLAHEGLEEWGVEPPSATGCSASSSSAA